MKIRDVLASLFIRQDEAKTSDDNANKVSSFNTQRDTFKDNDQVIVNNLSIEQCNIHLNTGNSFDTDYDSRISFELKKIAGKVEDGQYDEAIQDYITLLSDLSGNLEPIDKIEVSIGLLNCYLNKQDRENTTRYIDIIESNEYLLTSPNGWKFYFCAAVHYYNAGNLDKSKNYIDKAIKMNNSSERIKVFYILCNPDEHVFREVIEEYFTDNWSIVKDDYSEKDKKYAQQILGLYALNQGYYEEAIFILEALDSDSYINIYNLALAYHLHAVSKSDGVTIEKSRIYFPYMKKSLECYEKLIHEHYNDMEEDVRRSVANNFLQCLYLADEIEQFKTNYSLSILKDDIGNEVRQLYSYILYTESGVNTFIAGELSYDEKLWIKALDLYNEENYQGVLDLITEEELETDLCQERFFTLKLDTLVELGYYEEFQKVYDIGIKRFSGSHRIRLMKSKFIKYTSGNNSAIEFIKSVDDYEKVGAYIYDVIANLSVEGRFQEAYDELALLYNSPYASDFIKNNAVRELIRDLMKAEKFKISLKIVNELPLLCTSEITKMKADVYFYSGHIEKSIDYYLDLYNNAKTDNVIYKLMMASVNLNRLDNALTYCNELISIDENQKSHYLCIQSNIYLLMGDHENSYKAIKEAVELDKDLPTAESHPIYTMRSFRLNKSEDTGYIYEYANKYPTHNDWLKPMKAFEKNEDGTDVFTEEFAEYFVANNKRFKNDLFSYNRREFNYSFLCNRYGNTYIEMLSWRDIYGISIWIDNGKSIENTKPFDLSNGIILDSGGLYILLEIGVLNSLMNSCTVNTPQSTIEQLQILYIREENSKVKELLDLVANDESIRVLPNMSYNIDDGKPISELMNLFKEDQLDSLGASVESDSVLVVSDVAIKALSKHMAHDCPICISIVALLKMMNKERIIDQQGYLDSIINLKRNKYDFITITSSDLFLMLQRNGFEFNKDVEMFFKLNQHCDLVSYVNLFTSLLSLTKSLATVADFDKILLRLLKLADEYISKRTFYLHKLSIQFPEYSSVFFGLMGTANLEQMHDYHVQLSRSADYDKITSTYEYKRNFEILRFNKSLLTAVFKIDDIDTKKYVEMTTSNSSLTRNELIKYCNIEIEE